MLSIKLARSLLCSKTLKPIATCCMQILNHNDNQSIQFKPYSSTSQPTKSLEKWNKMIEDDKKYGKLVYVGQLKKILTRTKYLSLTSSCLGLAMMPYLYDSLHDTASMVAQIGVYATASFFIFLTPCMLHVLTRRHVNKLFYNYEEKKFTAVLYNFFLLEYKIEFYLDDVHVPDLPGIFTTVIVKSLKNRPLFIDYNQIIDSELVEKLLGYDKPLDIHKYDEKK